jgi:isocitrate dehydrogenase (NAD+)
MGRFCCLPVCHPILLRSISPNGGTHARALLGQPGCISRWRGMPFRATLKPVSSHRQIVVCDGDETGQELLEEALRVLAPDVLGLDLELVRFDLSLENRRATANAVVREAAAAMRETGLGLKAATITPEKTGDVGSPNRILREGIGGSVIVRTGRRIPGVAPLAPVVHPIVVVRMAVGDAYGAEELRTGEPGGAAEQAWRTERIDRSVCRSVAEFSFRTAAQLGACVYGGPKWTVSTVYEGMLKEEMDSAASRYSEVPYRPTLIDAAYAGLLTESSGSPLVVPALNRDGDCLSDLVLALFGSIAGAESVLLALDDEMHALVAMAEAPHGTAPSLKGKDVANPMAMLLACAAVLDHAAKSDPEVARMSAAIRRATLGAAADGIRTFDLGGEASTSEVVDEVLARVRAER